MIEKIYEFIRINNLIHDNQTIVIGFSGGPDSLFLLHFLAGLRTTKNITLVAAHLDHEWRQTSGQELLFCKSVAESLNIPFVSARLSELTFDKKSSGSQEELGRRARRFFLETVRTEHSADAIALAHHADDQEETFFIRLIRGATVAGLASMKPRDGYYIRPLLSIHKHEILTYLDQQNLVYVTDPSNMSDTYLRTRIRNNVIPALRASDSRFDANFQNTLRNIQQADAFLEELTEKTFSAIAQLHGDVWHLDLALFLTQHPFMQNKIMMHWLIKQNVPFVPTQKFLSEMLRFLQQPGNKQHAIHHSWALVKHNDRVWIQQAPK